MNSMLDIMGVKYRVRRIIHEVRDFPPLTISKVVIDELRREDNTILVRGTYSCESIIGNVIERGMYEVLFNRNLELLKVNVKPVKVLRST